MKYQVLANTTVCLLAFSEQQAESSLVFSLKPIIKERTSTCASDPSYAYSASASSEVEPMTAKILDSILAPANLRLTS